MTTPTKSGGAFGDLLDGEKKVALFAFVVKAMENQPEAVGFFGKLFEKVTLDGDDDDVYKKIAEVLGGEEVNVELVIPKHAKAYNSSMIVPAATFTEFLRSAKFDAAGFLQEMDIICGTTGSPFFTLLDGTLCGFDPTQTHDSAPHFESNRYLVRLLKHETLAMMRFIVTSSVSIAIGMVAAKLLAVADAESRAGTAANGASALASSASRLPPEVELLTALVTSMRSDFRTVIGSVDDLKIQMKGEIQSVVSSVGALRDELSAVQVSVSVLRAMVDDKSKHSEALSRVVAEQGATVRQLASGRRHNPSSERQSRGSRGLFTVVNSSLLTAGDFVSASLPRGPSNARKKEDPKDEPSRYGSHSGAVPAVTDLTLGGDEHGSAGAAFDGDDRSLKVPAEILAYLGVDGRSISLGSFGMKEHIGRETKTTKRGNCIYQTSSNVKVIRQQYVFGKDKPGEDGGSDFELTTCPPSEAISSLSFIGKEKGNARLTHEPFGLDGGLLEVIMVALDEFSRLTCVIAADLRTLSGRGHLPDVDIFTNIIMASLFLNQWQGMWSDSVLKLRFCDPTRLVKDMQSNCRTLVASYNGSSPNWTRLLLGWWCPSCKDPDSPPSVYLCNTKKCREMVAALQTNVFTSAKTSAAAPVRGGGLSAVVKPPDG